MRKNGQRYPYERSLKEAFAQCGLVLKTLNDMRERVVPPALLIGGSYWPRRSLELSSKIVIVNLSTNGATRQIERIDIYPDRIEVKFFGHQPLVHIGHEGFASGILNYGAHLSVHEYMPDDLKRIRGIGILIERKLQQLGCWSYIQIASWTADDINRMNAELGFSSRIEKENWIGQATILAAGGSTEFSRRIDSSS